MSDGTVTSQNQGFSILDLGPEGKSPEPGPSSSGDNGSGNGGGNGSDPFSDPWTMEDGGNNNDDGGSGSGGGALIALKDHPSYTKYFKMIKVGMDKDNVKFKMEQDGISPDILDRDTIRLGSQIGRAHV